MSLQLVGQAQRLLPGEGFTGRGALARTPGETLTGPGDVLVTRHQILTGEKKQAPEPVQGTSWLPLSARPEPFFVDWLSIHQSHPEELPVITDGEVLGVDGNGELVWKTSRKRRLEGSFETSVQVKCDGHTVFFEGNMSRFGRTNNVFGFDLAECLRRVNQILAKLGLPPFTWGRKFYRPVKTKGAGGSLGNSGEVKECWTGARISRIDLTANYGAGSGADARAYMEWLGTQQHSARVKVGTHYDGETVDWGRGSRRVYAKAYLKSAELLKHAAPAEFVEYCEEVGLIRFEVTVKATQLIAMGCEYLGSLDMAKLIELFQDRQAVMQRAEHTHDDLAELPNHLRRTARDYLAGDNLAATLSTATFYRHRAALLRYGLDISVKRNVVNFQPKVRVIELRPLSAPPWYQFGQERLSA